MKQTLLAIAVAILVLAACKREAEPAPATQTVPAAAAQPAAAPAPTDPTAGTDAIAVVDQSSPAGDNRTFDAKAFAGTFGATGTRLEIQADGAYRLSVHAESADADLTSRGSWTLEPDGRHILLDPESKDEADRRYQIVTPDELRALDGSQRLRRDGTGR